jgi:hypothetical protein
VSDAESFEADLPVAPHIEEATAVDEPRRTAAAKWPWLAVAGVVALGVLAAFLFFRAKAPAPSLVQAPPPPPTTSVAAPPSAEPVAIEPEPPPKAQPTSRPHSSRSQKRSPEANCKPWVIDKDGRKQFNEACLR